MSVPQTSTPGAWKSRAVLTLCVAAVLGISFVPAIPQDPAYHAFADVSSRFGIPNFSNVMSNLPFVLVGLFGLATRARLYDDHHRIGYDLFCAGIVLIGFGSAYYHLSPSTGTLLWDRAPMTIAFMALFSMIVSDRMSPRVGKGLLWPAVFLGLASVGYWYATELVGRGDLRPYVLVQFLPLVLIPLLLWWFPSKGLRSAWMWGTIVAYVLAKLAEHFDKALLDGLGFVSGHSLKHLLAALGVYCAVIALQKR